MTPTDHTPELLRSNLQEIRIRISQAAREAGRADPVQLLPVTKSVPVEIAACLHGLGETDLAENRADGLEAKATALPGVRWHFIGHLQRNKARRVVRHAQVLHSVDSPRLTEALARLAEEEEQDLELYLQVNFTGEGTKHGMDKGALVEALGIVASAPRLRARGLMAMAPLEYRPGHDAGSVFSRAAALAGQLREGQPQVLGNGLSMGMSGDLEVAIASGSTCVRVGTDIYRGLAA